MDEKLSLSKNDIKALIDKRKPVSMVTLKRRIKELLDNTYISEGEKDCNRKRYYINDNGINYVNNIVNIKNKLDIICKNWVLSRQIYLLNIVIRRKIWIQ